MKKMLAGLGLSILVLAGHALATPSWAPITTDSVSRPLPPYTRAMQGTFTASNGTDPYLATTTTQALGLNLSNVGGISVMAETASGGNMTAGGKFLAYLWNPATGKWEQVADGSLDLTAAAIARQSWSGFAVTADYSRIAWEPSGIGTPVNLYVYGTSRVLTPR